MKKLCIAVLTILLFACTKPQDGQEIWLRNPQSETLFIQVEGLKNTPYQKLAFLQHGLASDMEHPVIQTAKRALLDNGYVVVTFDSRYSLGKSEPDVKKVRLSTFEEDLKTVISWAKGQAFYHEPFALAGHSLGGASVISYAAEYPQQVNLLMPITPVISGDLWEISCMKNLTDFCKKWKEDGFYTYTHEPSGKTAVIPYEVITSCKFYDAEKLAPQIQATTLLVSAENDIIVGNNDAQRLSNELKDGKNIVISASGHNFESPKNQQDLYQALDEFIKTEN